MSKFISHDDYQPGNDLVDKQHPASIQIGLPFCAKRIPKSPDAAPNPRSAGLKRHGGGLSFGYFSLAEHKFAWSEFEQPKAGPKGENHGWFS